MKEIRILYLSLNSNLQGPFPRIDSALISAISSLGCRVTKLSWGRHSEYETLSQKIVGRFKDILRAFLALIQEPYDILYVMTTLDEYALSRDIPLLLATYFLPVKKILIEHGSKTAPLTKPGHSLYKFLTGLLIRLSDAILLLSTEELKCWTDFEPKGRYYRVDNPFIPNLTTKSNDPTNILQNINSSPTLLFVGRLIKEKGIFELLEAMPIILRQVNCHLLIAGDGEEKMAIIRQIERMNLSESVSLMGYLDSDQLFEIYRLCSLFILPSYREGFPSSITEAMSYGLPVITTPVGGIPDHLQNGVNALFIKPQKPDDIANAVVNLLNDPKLCLEMHYANLEKIKEFIPENVAPKYFEIFSEILDKDVFSYQ